MGPTSDARVTPKAPLVVALAGLLFAMGLAHAQLQPGTGAEKKPEKPRTFKFEARDLPWDKALDILAGEAQVPWTGSYKPGGSFNIGGTPKEYTVAEVLDLMNDSLKTQKYILIRRPDSIMVISSEDPQGINPDLIPRIKVDDLEVDLLPSRQKHGRTELAQVIFPLNTLTREEAERDIKTVLGPFGKTATIAKGDKLLVTDTVGNLRRAKKLLDEIDAGPSSAGDFDVISLGAADGPTALKALQTNWNITGTTRPNGAPYLEYDKVQNVIIFKGTKEQAAKAREIVRKLGGGATESGNGVDRVRIITLERGTASDVVEVLMHLWPDLRANPIELVTQSQMLPRLDELKRKPAVPANPPKPPVELPKVIDSASRRMPAADEDQPRTAAPVRKDTLALADGPQLDDPADRLRPFRPNLPGKRDKPVLLAPLLRANGIMIGSDDPEALVLVDELVRYLTQPGGETSAVIPIRYASATEVATALDQFFNGRRQQSSSNNQNPFAMMMMSRGFDRGGGDRGGGDRGGGFAPAPASTPSSGMGPVRVVADTRTNSILVRAPALEMATIRRLLDSSLDVEGTGAAALVKNHIIKLKHATASEVAIFLRELYRPYLARSGGSENSGGFGPQFGFMFSGRGSGRDGGGDRSSSDRNASNNNPILSFAADDRTNFLVVSCSDQLFAQVNDVVEKLDVASVEATKTWKVVKLENLDPLVAQQAIDAITGQQRRANNQNNNSNNNNRNNNQSESDRQREMLRRMMEERGRNTPGAFPGTPGGGSAYPGSGRDGGSRSTFPGGGGRRPDSGPAGGSDFFVDRVKDDPNEPAPVLFDPQQAQSTFDDSLILALFQQQPPEAVAPRPGQVTIEVVPELGQIIIIGPPKQVEEILKVLETLVKLAPQVQIRIFPLENADATSVANYLTQLYQRLNVSAGGISRVAVGQQLQQASVIVLPLPRQNAILVAAPESRMKDIESTIRKLDAPIAQDAQTKTYALQKANAAQVAATLQQFYAQRFPLEGANQNQVRIQPEAQTNTIFVQAGPADQEDIGRLITYMDTQVSKTVNELRIVKLTHSTAAELATILQQAIAESVAPTPTTPTQPTIPGVPGAPGTVPGAPGPFPGAPGTAPGAPGTFPGPTPGAGRGTAAALKTLSLRFQTRREDGLIIETGFLEGIRITPDIRTNTLIVSAPPNSMELLLALIKELDVPPAAQAEVKVFPLKKADATSMAQLLQQLFLGIAAPTGGARPGLPGAFPGALGGLQGGLQRPLTVGATTGEGAPLVELRIAIDIRTNSLIIAGSRGDLILAEAIIIKLDSADIRERRNEVYKLRNTTALDVATALNQFLRTEIQVLGLGELSPFTQIEREVVVVPEAISNSLIISATPRFFEEVMRLVFALDEEPPQVVIQVLIAEVRLDNTEEFGVELGFQSPILFARGITGGVVVNNATQVGAPGFNFNTLTPLPNSALFKQGSVADQAITNFGVGRANTQGLGGFIFSASSDSVNVLIRALKTQGKVEVLSRPQITALDNQIAFIQVGQLVPYITSSTIGIAGQIINTVQQQPVGVILVVTPKISPDGNVVMRVEPQVSSLTTSTVNLGNNVFAPIFNVTQASTTVSAMDGQTVVIGGLITRRDEKLERKVPWLGDLAYIGAAFRFRTQTKQKTELLILLTPHVIRGDADAFRILAEETRKMNWNLHDVQKVHQPLGIEGLMPGGPGLGMPGCELPAMPIEVPLFPPVGEQLPLPKPSTPPLLPKEPETRGPALAPPPPPPVVESGLAPPAPPRPELAPPAPPVAPPISRPSAPTVHQVNYKHNPIAPPSAVPPSHPTPADWIKDGRPMETPRWK